VSVDPAELRNEAQHRLRRWAGHDESLIFAADFGDLVDQLVQAGTRGLAEADEQGQVAPEGPLGLLAEAALLVRCKALSLAGKGDTPASRSVLKHAGFIALTVALRQPDAVPESLHLAVALAASSWSADLLAQVQGAGRTGLLDEAVDSARLALRMGAGLRQPPGRRTLATALAMRFERSGEQADIDAAVLLYRQLAGPQEEQEAGPHGGPAGGRPVPPDVLHNLGVALRTRFEFLGETADLDDAVQALTRAVAAAAGSLTPGIRLPAVRLSARPRHDH